MVDTVLADNSEDLKAIEQRAAMNALLSVREEKNKEAFEPRSRLTPSQWREIEILWESGEVTLKNLSEKYGKHQDTFANHFKRHGIKKGSRAEELRRVAEQVLREQAKNEAGILSERIKNTKDQHYKMAEAISKLIFNEVLNVRKNDGKYRDIQQDLKSLHIAMDALKKAREERWAVLGLDNDIVDEDALPELVMSTMTPEQAQALRDAQQEDEEEMGIDDDKLNMQTEQQ